jgi:hypothetical protein
VPVPTPEAAALRGMMWGIKSSFVDYIAGMPDGAMSVTDGAVAADGGFLFPVIDHEDFDRSTGLGLLRFGGDVRFRAHNGVLSVRIAHPELVADGDGARILIRDVRDEPLELAWLGMPEPLAGGGLRIPAMLAPAGVPYFNDVYPQGSELDPILIRGV